MNRVLKALGLLLAVVAGGYFVVHAYRALAGRELSTLLDTKVFAAMCLLTLLYMTSILTTAAAWSRLLRNMEQPHRFLRFLAILASTQFGKYLPGNIGHHLGRVALAARSGVGLGAATLSIGYELLLAVMATAHISAVVLILAPPDALRHSGLLEYKWLMLGALTAGALLGLALAPRLAEWMLRLRSGNANNGDIRQNLRLNSVTIVFCYLMYVTGASMVGLGLWGMAHALSGAVAVPNPFFFIGAFAASWILGLLAPGAPAGLGIREAALSALLGQALAAPQVIVLVIAMRIASTVGDLLNFLLGSTAVLRFRPPTARNTTSSDDGAVSRTYGQDSQKRNA